MEPKPIYATDTGTPLHPDDGQRVTWERDRAIELALSLRQRVAIAEGELERLAGRLDRLEGKDKRPSRRKRGSSPVLPGSPRFTGEK